MKRSGARYPAIGAGIYAALAVAAVVIGVVGWRDDPLSWVFAVLLAQPWIALLGPAVDGFLEGAGAVAGVLVAIVGLVINGCLVYGVLRWISFRRRDRDGFTRR